METKIEIQREKSWKAAVFKCWDLRMTSREEEIGQGYQCP